MGSRNRYLNYTGLSDFKDRIQALINSTVASGKAIKYNTEETWNSYSSLISGTDTLYVFTKCEGPLETRVKIGDGSTVVRDLPFVDTAYYDHLTDTSMHVSAADRERWDNKVTAFRSAVDKELVIFSK